MFTFFLNIELNFLIKKLKVLNNCTDVNLKKKCLYRFKFKWFRNNFSTAINVIAKCKNYSTSTLHKLSTSKLNKKFQTKIRWKFHYAYNLCHVNVLTILFGYYIRLLAFIFTATNYIFNFSQKYIDIVSSVPSFSHTFNLSSH